MIALPAKVSVMASNILTPYVSPDTFDYTFKEVRLQKL